VRFIHFVRAGRGRNLPCRAAVVAEERSKRIGQRVAGARAARIRAIDRVQPRIRSCGRVIAQQAFEKSAARIAGAHVEQQHRANDDQREHKDSPEAASFVVAVVSGSAD